MSATSFVDNVKSLTRDTADLVTAEIRLARAEMSEKIDQAQSGLIAILAGLLISFVAVMVLVQALVVALANFMPAEIAALAVGGSLLMVGLIVLNTGTRHLKPENMAPKRTIRAARKAGERVREAL
jgi:uncharacterized membrane protein YqjE